MINAQPKKNKEDRKAEKKARKKVKAKAKPVKKISAKKEKERLDAIFSIYIRLRDCLATSGNTEVGDCFTCGTRYHFSDLQNGHFMSRKYLTTRFYEDNCHIQCAGCNVFKSGNYIEYTTRMIDKYGRKYVDEIRELATKSIKFSAISYIEMQGNVVKDIENLTGYKYIWGKPEGKSYKKWVRA